MITWLETPFKGTNRQTGFETLIHGFYMQAIGGMSVLRALCVDEAGVLYDAEIQALVLDWRYTRGKGWHSIDEPEPEP
jgi:hypothetical protein